VREVREETGLDEIANHGKLETIDWYFRFRGKLIHKVCHFFLMFSEVERTRPQRDEGITACRWLPIDEARELISYGNAKEVLEHAYQKVVELPTHP
jgi:8-oxo-dGTP pyrophosphatase MutT (NUDIX family)